MTKSLEPILVKLGMGYCMTAMQLFILKSLVGAVVILPMTRRFRLPDLKDIWHIGSVSVLLLATNLVTLLALERLTAITVITITTSTPAFVALSNTALGRDKLSLKFWIGFVLSFVGVLLTIDVFGQGGLSLLDSWGLIFAFCAVASSSVYRVRMEGLTARLEPRLVSTWVFWINAAVVLLFIMPFAEPVPKQSMLLGGWIGFVAALANVAFLWAIKEVGSTNISIYNMLQRPMVIVAAALILKEPVSLLQFAGIVMVLIGIPMAKAKRLQAQPAEQLPLKQSA